MGAQRRIYTLSGLPPEVIAVAFAKTSRCPDPFDKIAAELNEDKSRQFHEKWVIGYGHGSIMEHAVLSIALENVSILLTKFLEDNRLASYTEKSTRYQVFDKEHYYKPENLMSSDLGKIYEETCDFLIDKYTELVQKMTAFMQSKYPKAADETGGVYNTKIKNKVLDNLRCLLPVSILTNLGMTINTRNLRWAIVKLASSDLKEFNEIGAELKQCAENITPTLLKHAEKNEFIEKNSTLLKELSIKLITGTKQQKENTVDLVEYDKNGEDKIICSILYKNTGLSYLEIKQKVINLSKEEKGDIIQKAFEGLGKFDIPIRETEMPEYIFDILMDYGAFRDVQRHRICTQINPDLDVDYGYSIPEDVIEAGMEADYKSCMEKAKETFTKIKEKFPKEAQYVVPLAYRKRVLIKMNFREAFHFIRLRSGKQGHASYRKIAQNMYDLIKDVHPMLGKQLVVDKT